MGNRIIDRTMPIIEVSGGEFGTQNWTLIAYGKSFYLGQDVKFCHRVLGMNTDHVVDEIGSSDLRRDSVRRKLATFILNSLELTRERIKEIQPWELCCQ